MPVLMDRIIGSRALLAAIAVFSIWYASVFVSAYIRLQPVIAAYHQD
jgi:hypothetical protein